jgi:hypothetical protein
MLFSVDVDRMVAANPRAPSGAEDSTTLWAGLEPVGLAKYGIIGTANVLNELASAFITVISLGLLNIWEFEEKLSD